jgi:hypothetical protein
MEKEEGVSLETLGQGAAVERFNLALQDVLNNIQDVNTNAKAARVVTLKATIKPSEDRGVGTIVVDVVSKMAPIKPFDVHVFLGVDNDGHGHATEYVQPPLFDPKSETKPKQTENIYKINKEAQA